MSGAASSDRDFAASLRSWRALRRLSLSDVALALHYDRTYVHHVESRRRHPSRQFATEVDRALQAGGDLVAAWMVTDHQRRQAGETRRLVTRLADESDALTALIETPAIDLADSVVDLATSRRQATPAAIPGEAAPVRAAMLERLRAGGVPRADHADLLLSVGRISGILAYASLDLGYPQAAETHCRTTWRVAELLHDNELKMWVRGTQSLIARFERQFHRALDLAQSGLQFRARGTGRIRLLCGEAQSLANLGQGREAVRGLDEARAEREGLTTDDSLPGLFAFSEAKQLYYTGSSLIWVPTPVNTARAASEVEQAIASWEHGAPDDRSLVDENLARIYLGTARLQGGELEGAVEAIGPVLALASDHRVSWTAKRLDRFAGILLDKYSDVALAIETRDAIASLAA